MNNAANKKLLELEGLRGLASLCVVVGHIQGSFFLFDFQNHLDRVAAMNWPLRPLLTSLSEAPFNGRFAVWVFWTLSGFALSYRFFVLRDVQHSTKSRSYLLDAALRRYPRLLLPVVAATLFSYSLIKLGLMGNHAAALKLSYPGHFNSWLADAFSFTPQFPNALGSAFWSTFFSSHVLPYYDPPLWTMKRELLGSFFIFSFLACFGGMSWRWLVYLAGGLFFIRIHQIWVDAFLAGILLCDIHVNHLQSLRQSSQFASAWIEFLRRNLAVAAIGAVTLVFLVGYFGQATVISIDVDPRADFSYIFLAFLTIIWVQFSRPVKALLSSPFWAFIGKISFGIYICHLPFIMSFSTHFYLWMEPAMGHLPAAFLTALVTLPGVIGLGTIFYWVADKPSVPFSKFVAEFLISSAGALTKACFPSAAAAQKDARTGIPGIPKEAPSFNAPAPPCLVPPQPD
jgi:peptidoglycan/LPS O-acetylase OafA/YrhL